MDMRTEPKIVATADFSPTFHRDGTKEISFFNKVTKQWTRAPAAEIDTAVVDSLSAEDSLRLDKWAGRMPEPKLSHRGKLRRSYTAMRDKRVNLTLPEQAEFLDTLHDAKVVMSALFEAAHKMFEPKGEASASEMSSNGRKH